jgi:putative ABC transport system permease protein
VTDLHFNRENFSFALANVLEHKFRSLLAILGIIVGIVTVVLVASILIGVRNNIALLFQEFGPDSIFAFHLNGDPGSNEVRPEERTRRPLRTEFAAKILSRCPSVKDGAAQIYVPNLVQNRPLTARYAGLENENIQVQGTTWNFAQVTSAELQAGRMYTYEEERRHSKVCVLGANIADSLFPSGDAVGKRIVVDGAIYAVIGVFEKRKGGFIGENRQDNVVMIPLETIQRRYPEADTVILYFQAFPGKRDAALFEIESALRTLRGLKSGMKSDFNLSTADSIMQQLDRITGMIRTGTLAISGLGLLVGGIGVMNIMLMSVTQRTREIGIRKAIGARRWDIILQFLLEAAFLTTTGGVLGVALAVILGLAVGYFVPNLPVMPPFWAITSGLSVSTLVGLLFGVWPAAKAARLDPVDALRHE